jgi:class 3 adenylate cyclase
MVELYDAVQYNEAGDQSSVVPESNFSLALSNIGSELAHYLTKKGSGVDTLIKWGEILCPHANDTSSHMNPFQKRSLPPCSDSVGEACGKRHCRAAVPELTAEIDLVQQLLSASIPSHRREWGANLHMSCEGSSTYTFESSTTRDLTHNDGDLYQLDDPYSGRSFTDIELGNSAARPRTIPGTPCTECSYLSEASTPISLSSLCSWSPRTMRLSTHIVSQATVLFIDIKGFTSACAAMPASRVGEWVADFNERVDAAAAAHGVAKVEARGDCCVCVTGAAGAVPSRAFPAAAADPRADQATRMLAFAAALHEDLRTLSAAGAATATRMGVASGEVTFFVSAAADAAAGPAAAAACFASAQGDAVALAARMEALAGPGAVRVHRSAAHRWAAETRSPPPPSGLVDGGAGRGPQRAAVFDCTARAFRPAAPAPARAASADRAAGLRRSASAP